MDISRDLRPATVDPMRLDHSVISGAMLRPVSKRPSASVSSNIANQRRWSPTSSHRQKIKASWSGLLSLELIERINRRPRRSSRRALSASTNRHHRPTSDHASSDVDDHSRRRHSNGGRRPPRQRRRDKYHDEQPRDKRPDERRHDRHHDEQPAIDATARDTATMETATTAATKPTAATTTAAYGLRNGLSRSRRPTMRYRKRAGLNSREHWRREQRGTHGEGQQ